MNDLKRDYFKLLRLEMATTELEGTIPTTDDPEYDHENLMELAKELRKLSKAREAFFAKYGSSGRF